DSRYTGIYTLSLHDALPIYSDYSYLEMPARATMLYSIEVPRAGGDTLFADQYAAYDDLPGAMKKRLEGLVAMHHYGNRDDLEERSEDHTSELQSRGHLVCSL